MWIRCDECSLSFLLLLCTNVDWVVVAHFVLVPDMGMSMRESSSLDILSWDSDMIAILDKGCKSQCLSSSPINALTIRNRFTSSLEYLLNKSMEFFILRQMCDFVTNIFKSIEFNTRDFCLVCAEFFDRFPFRCNPIFSLIFQSLWLLVCIFHLFLDACFHVCCIFWSDDTFIEELLLVDSSNWLHLIDLFVHHGLGETWLIKFVVAPKPISN